MNRIFKYLFPLLLLGVIAGCKKDEVEGDTPIYPRIFDSKGVFQTLSRIINEGESAVYEGLAFTPTDKIQTIWTVNNEQVSTDPSYTFTPTEGGEFEIVLKAIANGDTSIRKSKVLVNPTNFTFKPYNQVSLGYLTATGNAANVQWDNVSHVVLKSARVLPEGTLNTSDGDAGQVIDELIARGHTNGVHVMLGISGRLSGIDGWSLYGANDLGSVITDPAKSAALVEQIKTYVTAKRLDGVDVLMSDVSVNTEANVAAVGPFLAKLKTALPGSIITATVAASWVHSNYKDMGSADWVNVRAFDPGTNVGPGAVRGDVSTVEYMKTCADIWKDKLPAEKIVLGLPAYAVKYNEIDENGNNLGWGSYEYLTLKQVLAIDASAFETGYLNNAQGIYCNSKSVIQQKLDYIRQQGFKGAYLWALDYDGPPGSSINEMMYNTFK